MADPVQTIDQAVARLEGLEQSLPPSDGVRWFNRLYLEVTLAVRAYCASGKLVASPFLQDLDVYFANRYFEAYDAASNGAPVPACWEPMFDARHDPRIAPLQFALAGMNAHIGHDLPIGVVETCQALGLAPDDGSPQHTDYEAVNAIMKQTEAATKQWLLTGAIKELDHDVAPMDDAAAVWSIEAAREAAWVHGEVLWHLRESSDLTNAYLAVLDRTVGMENRALLLVRGI
ncbi:MAG: hypothetical protein JO372_03310 [Solirubrobacterales bacterium]|nr:hypothetical protein [Solirubrobacterales bacterium]